MNFIYLLILILLFVVILAFTALLRVAFVFDTEKENVRLTLLWLYPFLKVIVESNASVPVMSIYCFKRNVYRKELISGSSERSGSRIKAFDVARSASTKDMQIDASYGFRDPFVTGLACGAVSAASQNISIVTVTQSPDFIADNDYIFLNATGKVNLGSTIVNYIRHKTQSKY